MKWQRCTTATPGQSASTMNAVICRFSLPFTTVDGVRAITTISSALVPLVHHSFSPFKIHACPSSLGTASVSIAAGSDPTPGSVSANAEIAPCPQEALQLFQARLRPPNLLGVLLGVRVDQRHAEAPEEQVADEARRDPVLFACRFGDLAGLVGADVALWRGERGHGCLPP